MTTGSRRWPGLALLALLALAGPAPAQQINWSVTINDPTGLYTSYYSTITANVQAAGARWSQFLQPAADVTVSTEVVITSSVPRATGASTTTSFVGNANGFTVWEPGAAHLIRTGANPNSPGAANVRIELNPDYMQNTLWWDPNPTLRTAPVPNNRNDSTSVMLHELGHALGFNGWRDLFNGSLPGNYMSTFDRYVSFNGSEFYFNGPAAVAAHGGPVPLTYGNIFHVGNAAGSGPGQDLIPDLMNGVVFYYGQRYDISDLDRAILADTGLTLAPVPEPGWVLAVAAAGAAVLRVRRRGRRSAADPVPVSRA